MLVLGRLGIVVVLTLLATVACSSDSSPTKQSSPTVVGKYTLVGDVGGTKVKSGASVTLTLKADGTLTVVAEQPGQKLTDTGTWSLADKTITIAFKDQQIKGTGVYEFDGTTLKLPVLVFGEGKGVSEWTRVGASSPSGTSSSTPSSSSPPAQQGFKDDQWDLEHDAAAAGTKVYSDAVAKGVERKQAVQQAAAKARSMPEVSSAEISSNGLNVAVTYSDGQVENIVTERLQPPSVKGSDFRNQTAASAPGCETLIGQSPNPQEPGREGVNPGGGYGVSLYNQTLQPKSVSSADTPASKRALLISPQYDIKHPLHKVPTSIRDVSGDNIECLEASLKKVGYTVDTILGKSVNGKNVNAGDEAIQQLIDKLTTQKYGVVYFLGHGYLERTGNSFAGMWLGAVDLNRPEIKAVLNGKKIDRVLAVKVKQAYAKLFGLTWVPADPVFDMAPDDDGTASIVVKPAFFTQLRAKGADFSQTFMMINACSSAATPNMAQAVGAKAYIGWKSEMDGAFLGNASEAILDMLTDKARTVRAASQLWQIHEKWKATGPALDPAEDWQSMSVVGQNQQPYSPIDAQTYILIFRLRHGPSSATSNITKSAAVIKACYEQVWKKHLGALASPACHALDYGNSQPTEGQVVDSFFDVGVQKVGGGPGRWTLAD